MPPPYASNDQSLFRRAEPGASRPGERGTFPASRLELFIRTTVLFLSGFYVISNLALELVGAQGDREWIEGIGNQVTLGALVGALVVGAIVRWARLSARSLAWIDGLFVLWCSVAFSVYLWAERESTETIALTQLPLSIAIVARAAFLPRAALNTALISSIAYVPFLAVLGCVVYSRSADQVTGELRVAATLGVVYALVVVALAAYVSQIIYGLRMEVGEARKVGQYRLEREIGRGGMGVVFRATHALLRRPTALKLLHPERVNSEAFESFEREVQLTSQLTHPNTIAIFDYGRDVDGTFYYAMELLDGLDLSRLVERHGPQPSARVIYVLRQVCASLAEAHGRRMIHRDIKPSNIILCERGGVFDTVKVLDFGLVEHLATGVAPAEAARPEGLPPLLTGIVGTPHYMSPESIETPDQIDGRSDLYAVGAVGYFLLTGGHVFDGADAASICRAQLEAKPDAPSERLRARVGAGAVAEAIDADLEKIVLRCLEKHVEDRFPNAESLGAALGACASAADWSPERAGRWWAEHAPARTSAVARVEPSVFVESTEPVTRAANPR